MIYKILMLDTAVAHENGHPKTFKEGTVYDVSEEIYKPFVERRKLAILYVEEPEKVVTEEKAEKAAPENKALNVPDNKDVKPVVKIKKRKKLKK